MGNVFAKKHHITDVDKAVLTLKTQRRKLVAERKRVENVITREIEIARQLIAQGNKSRALLALKKKKVQQGRIDQLDVWLLNVEEMLGNIENTKNNNQIYSALKQGNSALKELQKDVSVEDVEMLMEDSAEAKATQERMSEALSESLTPEEDEDVAAELKAMESSSTAHEVAEELPDVPQHTPALPTDTKSTVEPVELLQAQAEKQGHPVVAEEPIAA